MANPGDANKLAPEDRPAHAWYRFVLSFPPHLVRDYLSRFEVTPEQCVLDPFCGTGTTLVECKKLGIPSVGIEANPMAHFAAKVKTEWGPDPDALAEQTARVALEAGAALAAEGAADDPALKQRGNGHDALRTLPPESSSLLLADSISPLALHKTLVLLAHIHEGLDGSISGHALLALARAVVVSISNLHFGPEVGVGPVKSDAAVIAPWLAGVQEMGSDLRGLAPRSGVPSIVHRADARDALAALEPNSVDAVFTSPPYPNEKDYTRTTRLESVLLGFIKNRTELQALKKTLVRSNTRGVYKGDDDDHWVRNHPEIQRIADAIEARRLELGKTSGFERLYPRVTRLYFGGMARHLSDLRTVLRPGARLGYVVGDQASYLRVMIHTGQLLADVARDLGYEVVGIDLFRTRLATATKAQLREEVVVLRWPG